MITKQFLKDLDKKVDELFDKETAEDLSKFIKKNKLEKTELLKHTSLFLDMLGAAKSPYKMYFSKEESIIYFNWSTLGIVNATFSIKNNNVVLQLMSDNWGLEVITRRLVSEDRFEEPDLSKNINSAIFDDLLNRI